MIDITIPGYKTLQLAHLVLDFNGTLAVDGVLVAGVRPRLEALAENLTIHVLTADTFGTAQAQLADIPCRLSILAKAVQDIEKRDYVTHVGAAHCVCLGNGRNDRLMLAAAGLSIAVILAEGAATETIQAADIICNGIVDALDILLKPRRLTATLRS